MRTAAVEVELDLHTQVIFAIERGSFAPCAADFARAGGVLSLKAYPDRICAEFDTKLIARPIIYHILSR